MFVKMTIFTAFLSARWYRGNSVRLWAIAVILLSLCWRSSNAHSPDDEWKAFRTFFPYHIQTIAVSQPYSNGTRMLIISEPPPHVTLASVREIQPEWFRDIHVMQQPIGYDGWVKDIVAVVSIDDGQLAQAISKLSTLLFHTSYKSHALQLPYQSRAHPENLDLKISAEELQSWLFEPKARFESIYSGPELTLDAVRASSVTQVYFTSEPGLVLWWIPQGTKLDEHLGTIRQFALDSDLIVEAQLFDEGVLIVARERSVPFDILPPLRVETIVRLASVDKDELQQSYERNYFLAGRYATNSDWAPVFLSSELRDTEYGSLLNITDQMLKSWSNNGHTRYLNFSYHDPLRWPFLQPIPLELGVKELTYNWNTSGAGYAVLDNRSQTYALNRTGALPISYIPGGDEAALANPDSAEIQKLRSAEETAYEYFANLQNPNLVRVVQYAALYQIFRRATLTKTSPSVLESQPEEQLKDLERKLLGQLRDANANDLRKMKETVVAKIKDFCSECPQEDLKQASELVGPSFDLLNRNLGEIEYKSLDTLIVALKSPLMIKYLSLIYPQINEFYGAVRLVLPFLAASQDFHRQYVSRVMPAAQNSWIHTPVVVLSSVSGPLTQKRGGHNLDSRISPFRLSSTVSPSNVEVQIINGKPVILINLADASKISKVVRAAGKNLSDPDQLAQRLHAELLKATPAPPRPMYAALGRHAPTLVSSTRLPRGAAFSPDHRDGFKNFNAGWQLSNEPPTPGMLDDFCTVRSFHQRSIMVKKLDDGSLHVMHNERGKPIKAYTTEDAIDLVVNLMRSEFGNPESMQIHLAGVSISEVDAIMRSLRVRASAAGEKARIVGRIHEKAISLEAFNRNVARDYDFTRATLKEAKNLPGNIGFQFTIEVPPRVNRLHEVKPGKIRSTVKFAREMTARLRDQIKRKITNQLDKILTRQSNLEMEPLMIIDDIHQEFRDLERETGIEIKSLELRFETNMGDFSIVHNEPKNEPKAGRTI